jgi:citronellyl-CoA synthetase
MAALRLARGFELDGAALGTHLDARLPAYAAPLFVRLLGEVETTGTFKYKKADLKQAGYDTRQVDDPLFVRLPSSTSFEPLDDELHAAIARQAYRF